MESKVMDIINEYCMNHGSYIPRDELMRIWLRSNAGTEDDFWREYKNLEEAGAICLEEANVYLPQNMKQEEYCAERLYELLELLPLPMVLVPQRLYVGEILLAEEQRDAVKMGLNSRLSLILAGAGSGKTTLIQALVQSSGAKHYLICAPTGKAANNLTRRTDLHASTVHHALGIWISRDFMRVEKDPALELIVVDEAAMLTLDMLAGLLRRAPDNCRIVLLGDTGQIPAVGAGRVVEDLTALGFPCARLCMNHRQSSVDAGALYQNVSRYDQISGIVDFQQDESFRFTPCVDRKEMMDALAREAVSYIRTGGTAQIIVPSKNDAIELNQRVQRLANPNVKGGQVLTTEKFRYMDGDRVVIIRNNRSLGCYNGETGILRIGEQSFSVETESGRRYEWSGDNVRAGLEAILPAYAITAHRAQGSEYDTVFVFVAPTKGRILNRNWLYTAISRARKRLRLYGIPETVMFALHTIPPERCSKLVDRTLQLKYADAG